MAALLPDIDPDGLLEFSVVYTDRALNHMSQRFVGVMQDILGTLKEVYGAHGSWLPAPCLRALQTTAPPPRPKLPTSKICVQR